MFIQTEQTPNPATLKFLPGCTVMESGTANFPERGAAALERDGHDVVRVRRDAGGHLDATTMSGTDAVVHLAGEGVASKRWSPEQKRRVLESRTTGTALVANTMTLPVDRRLAYLGLANRDRFVDVLLAGEAAPAVSLSGPVTGTAGGAATWAAAGVEPAAGRLKGVVLTTVVADDEDELSPLVGRVLQQGAQAAGAR